MKKKAIGIEIHIECYEYYDFGTQRHLMHKRDFSHFLPYDKKTSDLLKRVNKTINRDIDELRGTIRCTHGGFPVFTVTYHLSEDELSEQDYLELKEKYPFNWE